jgi:hydroxyethylthiazole kinase-like uncharacterized protein yjeF
MYQNIPVITQSQITGLLPKRPRDSYKNMFGTVSVIGGTSGMTGAALLAARTALKLGAGCVHAILLADDAPAVDLLQPELMLHKAAHLLRSYPHHKREGTNVQSMLHPDVLAVGCGMGKDTIARQMLRDALQSLVTLVLDADALNLLAHFPEVRQLLFAREAATILTPHPGEAARLLGCSTTAIQSDRVAAVKQLSRMFSCTVVLKGADSLCATRDGLLFINPTGNPGMSGPGMGDVLTGMIASFIAQGLSADNAVLLATYLHGAAGDELAKTGITLGMTASELTDQARRLLNQWVSQT